MDVVQLPPLRLQSASRLWTQITLLQCLWSISGRTRNDLSPMNGELSNLGQNKESFKERFGGNCHMPVRGGDVDIKLDK